MPARDMYQIRLFIENMGLGHTPTAAARLAGSKKPSRDGKEWIKDPDVLKQVQILQEENRKNRSLTRTDVMSNLIDAFNLGGTGRDACCQNDLVKRRQHRFIRMRTEL